MSVRMGTGNTLQTDFGEQAKRTYPGPMARPGLPGSLAQPLHLF